MSICPVKRIAFILLLALVSCSKPGGAADAEDAVRELPHFEYAGYTYYVHPHLNVYQGCPNYAEGEALVARLDSYGIETWFVPTLFELREAARNGILQQEYCYQSSDRNYLYFNPSEKEWREMRDGFSGSSQYTVAPMVKFRIR